MDRPSPVIKQLNEQVHMTVKEFCYRLDNPEQVRACGELLEDLKTIFAKYR